MNPNGKAQAGSARSPLQFCFAAWLDSDQVLRWRKFASLIPWADYQQDPMWAEVEECGCPSGERRTFFFWAERNGELCLTALGVRRRLPVPGRVFWEFRRGPLFVDPEVLDEWLTWLDRTIGRETARLRVEPSLPLDAGGDDVESMLEGHGFVRRRAIGTWSTLIFGIEKKEDQLLASLSSQTRRRIRKSISVGIDVRLEDDVDGWTMLSELQTLLSRRAPVSPIDVPTLACISRRYLAGGAGGTVIVARRECVPLAASLILVYHDVAYLHMLASSPAERNLPLSHLLVWRAILWAREQGCTSFDLEGFSQLARPGDSLWGVNQFKRGFARGAPPTKAVAVHEKVYSPFIVMAASTLRSWQARGREVKTE